jgi:hypothetical protein
VLGLRISLRHTIMRISRVITLAGGIWCGRAAPASGYPPASASLGCSSAVELDPSFVSRSGPASPASTSSTVLLLLNPSHSAAADAPLLPSLSPGKLRGSVKFYEEFAHGTTRERDVGTRSINVDADLCRPCRSPAGRLGGPCGSPSCRRSRPRRW